MLQIDNLSKKYHNRIILENFSYCFADTGFYGIIGRSGCGKSTLLNIIAGIIKPDSGDIIFNNEYYKNINNKKMASLRKNYISYINQKNILNEHLSLLKNIELIKKILNISIEDEKIEYYLKLFKIEDKKDQIIETLSGGEKQRIACIIAFLKPSSIILADEITNNLDPESSLIIFKALKEISISKLVILVSHDHKLVKEFCDIIIDYRIIGNYMKKLDIKKSEKNLTFENQKTKLSISKYMVKLKKANLILTNILIVLFILLGSLGFNFLEIKKTNLFVENLIESNSNYNYIQEKVNFDKYGIEYYAYYKNLSLDNYNQDDFETTQDYHNDIFTYPTFFDENLFKIIIIDNSLSDNEIIISDYIAKHFAQLNLLPDFKDANEVINKNVDYISSDGLIPFVIKDVFETDYLYYLENMDYVFIDKKSYDYNSVVMNNNTFINSFLDFTKSIECLINNKKINLENHYKIILDEIIGNDISNDNEIVMTRYALADIVNEDASLINVNNYLNKQFSINLFNKNYEFTLVGVVEKNYRSIFTSDGVYKTILIDEFNNTNSGNGYAFKFNENISNNLSFVEYLWNEDINIEGSFASNSLNITNSIMEIKANGAFFFIFVIIATAILIVNISGIGKLNRNLNLFLYNNGVAKKDIYLENLFSILRDYTFGFLLVLILNYPFVLLINLFISRCFNYLNYVPTLNYFSFLNFSIIGLLIPLLFTIFVVFIVNILTINKNVFNKK